MTKPQPNGEQRGTACLQDPEPGFRPDDKVQIACA
jgi:hypothetical protein